MRIEKLIFVAVVVGLLQACVAVDPGQGRNEKASSVNVQLGIGYLQQNKLELASEKLDKAIRQDPKSPSAHNAYAILQERLLQLDKAEYHYRRATTLDPRNSQAANNFGAFLCRNQREEEAEKYFLRAMKNPLYQTPEYALTNAAVCLLRIDQTAKAKQYLRKAIAAKNDFGPALLAMGDVSYKEGDFVNAKVYLDQYHLFAEPSARSLWLSILNSLELDSRSDVSDFSKRLEEKYPDSKEYQLWLEIQ